MRRVTLPPIAPMSMNSTPEGRYLLLALQEIARASFEADPNEVADAYTVSNYTETRTLNAGTATASDIANVLATFLDDLKRRGVKKG